MAVVYQSSQTNPNAANYKGSQTYAPQSRPGVNVPYIGTGTGGSGGQVLGASTYSGGAAPSNQQAGPAPEIPQPGAPSIDFDALIAPALAGLDAAIAPLQQSNAADIAGINTNAQQARDTTNQSITAQTNTIGQAQNTQKQYETSASDAARRQYSEIQQGLQSRYGGTTGTGAFAAEQAGTQTLRSMADIKTNAANAQAQLSDKLQQVQEVGRTALAHIESDLQDQIAKAKSNLEMSLADIRNQKGQLMARKAELAANAVQLYQQTVNQVNTANAQFKQQLYSQQQAAQQNLELALQKASGIAQAATPEELMQYVQSLQPIINSNFTPTYTTKSGGGSISLTPTKKATGIDATINEALDQQVGQ